MRAWEIITKALHQAGGGPLPRKRFDEGFESDSAAQAALAGARRHGLVVLTRHFYRWMWSLTPLGVDWREGRVAIGVTPEPLPEPPSEQEVRLARLIADSHEAASTCRRLNAGQRDVLMLLAKGYTRAEICGRFRIGPDAVERRITKTLKLTGCDRAIEAVVIATKAGLV